MNGAEDSGIGPLPGAGNLGYARSVSLRVRHRCELADPHPSSRIITRVMGALPVILITSWVQMLGRSV